MKKAVAVLGISAALAALIGTVPRAVESAAPVAETLMVSTRDYSETVCASGDLEYPGQHDVTSALPLVIEKYLVEEGDIVAVGDPVARVDRRASAALIESLGQLKALAIPASDLSAAIALLPETVAADRPGRIISTSGSSVQSGNSIVTIAETNELIVTAAVSELDIAKISLGQTARFSAAAYPGETFLGKVSDIAEAARSQYNGAVLETVVDITITPDLPDERLKAGFSAEVEIQLSDPRKICVLPYSAIGQDDDGEFVYVYEDGKAVRRGISTGAEFADGTEIKSGVSEDDIIFGDPLEIADRSYIRITEV